MDEFVHEGRRCPSLPWIVAALAALCLFAAERVQADEKEPTPRGKTELSPDARRLLGLFQSADDVIRGRVQSRKFLARSPLGAPATRYTLDEATSLKGAASASTRDVWILGGQNGKGLVLIPSKGGYVLEAGAEYVVFVRKAGKQEILFEVHRLVGPEKVLVDARGRYYGKTPKGEVRLSLLTTAATREYLRRACGKSPRAQGKPPVSVVRPNLGLTAKLMRPDDAEESLPAFTLDGLLGALGIGRFDKSGMTVDAPPAACEACDDYIEPFPFCVYLDEPISFHAHESITNEIRPYVDAGFRAWNRAARLCASRCVSFFGWAPPTQLNGLHPAFKQDDRSGIAIVPDGPITGSAYSLSGPTCDGACEGVCFLWAEACSGRIVEADILINRAPWDLDLPQRILKTVTHELGHALSFGHECGYLSIEAAMTSSEVPSTDGYADYARSGDYACLRKLIAEFNTRACRKVWCENLFVDIATCAAYHVKPGTACAPVLAYIDGHQFESNAPVTAGAVERVVGVHVENRGRIPAYRAQITFVLETRDGSQSHVVGKYAFVEPLRTSLAASYQIRIPSDISGLYHLTWTVRHIGNDLTHVNNKAWPVNPLKEEYAHPKLIIVVEAP